MSGLMFSARWPATCAASLDCDTSLKRRADIQPTGTYSIVILKLRGVFENMHTSYELRELVHLVSLA
jgi:hypothetical protein